MDVCSDDVDKAVGMGVGKLKSGVAISSVAAGDENEEGVDACSVANRFGVGEEPDSKSPQAIIKTRAVTIHSSLVLFIIRLD